MKIVDSKISENQIEESIILLFDKELTKKRYLYLSMDKVDIKNYIKSNIDDVSIDELQKLRSIESFFKSNNWNAKSTFNKRKDYISKVLMDKHKDAIRESNVVYFPDDLLIFRLDSLSSFLSLMPRIELSNNNIFFRGQSNFGWNLTPSIYREKRWIENEKLMIDKMLQSNPDEFNFQSMFDVLSKMQHYELPTRLLDVTKNPLVALYFACINSFDEDGQIYIFTPDKVNYSDSDTVSVLSNIAKMDIGFGKRI